MSLQQRIELQGAIQQWIDSFMINNQIDAATMEDALNKVLIKIKDQVINEMLIEAASQIQENQQLKEEESNG